MTRSHCFFSATQVHVCTWDHADTVLQAEANHLCPTLCRPLGHRRSREWWLSSLECSCDGHQQQRPGHILPDCSWARRWIRCFCFSLVCGQIWPPSWNKCKPLCQPLHFRSRGCASTLYGHQWPHVSEPVEASVWSTTYSAVEEWYRGLTITPISCSKCFLLCIPVWQRLLPVKVLRFGILTPSAAKSLVDWYHVSHQTLLKCKMHSWWLVTISSKRTNIIKALLFVWTAPFWNVLELLNFFFFPFWE